MITKTSLCAVFSATACFAVAGTAHASTTCASKEQAITQQIQYAQLHGNTSQVAGLQKALSETRQHCTDQSLRANLERNVQQKQQKVAQRQQDLADAQASGRADKIAKKQQQLTEAQQELQQAQDALH